MPKLCKTCDNPIPEERLEVLPETETCVKCSTHVAPVGYMVATASKGCAPVLIQIDPSDKEALRQARNAHIRKR